MGKMFLSLILVLVLIVVILKWGIPNLIQAAKPRSKHLDIVDRLPLDQRRGFCILRAGRRYHLIGFTDMGIAHLAELSPDDLSGDSSPAAPAGEGDGKSSGLFPEILDKIRRKNT